MMLVDRQFSEAKPGDTIKLPRGLVGTMGVTHEDGVSVAGAALKPGVSVLGHPDGTILMCIRASDGPEVSALLGSGENEVRDLVIDCGESPPARGKKRNGAYFYGRNNKLSNLIVLRPWGDFEAGRESFGISCNSEQGNGSTLQICEVREVLGDYQTGIQGPTLLNCNVEFPRVRPARGFWVAYNIGASNGQLIDRCTSRWAGSAVYTDWKDTRNVTIKNCTFVGCGTGLNLNAQQVAPDVEHRVIEGITFEGNEIVMDGRAQQVQAFLFDHSTPSGRYERDNTRHSIRDILVSNCRVRMLPGAIATPHGARLVVNAASFLSLDKRSRDLGISNVRMVGLDVEERDGLQWRSVNWNGRADVEGSITRQIAWEEQ